MNIYGLKVTYLKLFNSQLGLEHHSIITVLWPCEES